MLLRNLSKVSLSLRKGGQKFILEPGKVTSVPDILFTKEQIKAIFGYNVQCLGDDLKVIDKPSKEVADKKVKSAEPKKEPVEEVKEEIVEEAKEELVEEKATVEEFEDIIPEDSHTKDETAEEESLDDLIDDVLEEAEKPAEPKKAAKKSAKKSTKKTSKK